MSAETNISTAGGQTALTTAEDTAAAYGISAAITIVFNTLLMWFKEAYEPLKSLMVGLTGHHWITHALLDLILFFVLGWLLARRHNVRITYLHVVALAVATVFGGFGVAAWFFLLEFL